MPEADLKTTKLCPFCAEEIQSAAIVCRYCGRDLPNGLGQPYPEAPQAPVAENKDETVYLKNSDVTITSSRAIIKSKTYAMSNVTSVVLATVPPDTSGANQFGCFGLMLGLLIAGVSALMQSSIGEIIGVAVAGGAIGVAVQSAKALKPKYVVRIGSASGESDALWAYNKEYIQKIVEAMNEAIIRRG